MQHLHPIPEAEMVSTFLQTELASSRFRPSILAILQRDGREQAGRLDHGSLPMNPVRFTKTKLTQGQGAISAKRWDVSS